MRQQTIIPNQGQPAQFDGPAAMRARRREQWHFALLFIVVGLIRADVLIMHWKSLSFDPDGYQAIATNLEKTGYYAKPSPASFEPSRVVPTAYRPPLFPLFIHAAQRIGFDPLISIVLLHWTLGVATAMIMVPLAHDAGIVRGRWLPAILVAVDPILLHQSTQVMTETLATFLTVVLLFQMHRVELAPQPARLVTVGLSFGLAILCRPVFAVWLAMMCLGWLFKKPGEAIDSKVRLLINRAVQATVVLVAVGLLLTPWMVRNQLTFYPRDQRSPFMSRMIWTTTHGGYTLFLGNNNGYYDWLMHEGDYGPPSQSRPPVWPASDPQFQGDLTVIREQAEHLYRSRGEEGAAAKLQVEGHRIETQASHLEPIVDGLYYEAAWQTIGARPITFARACLQRVVDLWTPLPHRLETNESFSRAFMRYSVAGWYTLIYLGIAIAIFRSPKPLRRSPLIWGLLFCFALTLVHSIYWSNMRMRAPVTPVLSLMTTVGWMRIWQTIRPD